MPEPRRAATGSSTVFSEVRLAWIHSGRSSGSACGSSVGASARCRPTRAARPPRSGRRRARTAADSGAGLSPAMPSATVVASFQSITPPMVAGEPSTLLNGVRPALRRLQGSAGSRPARPASPRCAPPRSASAAGCRAARRAASSNHGKATNPPASRTISCAGGGVDRAAALAARPCRRAAPPRPGRASRRSCRARAGGSSCSASASAASRTQRGSADSMPSSSSRPSCAAALAGVGRQPAPVQPRALAAPRDPLLARAEVVDVAEEDVGHRVPARDRDRDRVVRQAALGVERAVDRVDHHEHVRVAEVDRAALLADRGEAQPLVVQRARARSNTASSAAASITSVRSPPSPRVPTSRTRSSVLGLSARIPRSASVARRQSSSQSVSCTRSETPTGPILRWCR